MKQRNAAALRTLCIAFGFIAVLSILACFLVKPGQPAEITQAYEYMASEETALPKEVPESIEKDGKTYTKVSFSEVQPEISVLDEIERYSKTVTIEDLPSEQAPETKQFDVNGEMVTLVLQSADYTQVMKKYEATGEVRYENQASRPDVPEYSDVTYVNEAGNTVTVEGKLQNVEQVSGGTGGVKNITSTISLPPGATSFVVGNKSVAYNKETPKWEGYQSDVLSGLGLSASQYTVTDGRWGGEPYYENGIMKRDIIWTIQPLGTATYVATYYAAGEKPFYTAVAVYGGAVSELGIDQSLANDIQYELSANVTYRAEIDTNQDVLTTVLSDFPVLMPAFAVASSILFIICLKLFVEAKKKSPKEAENKNTDSEESDTVGTEDESFEMTVSDK